MGLLRKAGEGIRNFDDAYTSKINQMYENANPAVRAAGVMVGGGHPTFRKGDGSDIPNKYARGAYEYGISAMSAVPKYVLPATGVTLAGKALIDIANGLGQQTESTLTV